MIYKYFAFISYSSKDTKWGKRLQHKLEHYRMPATLCSEHNWNTRTPIKPVFFAPTDIQPGNLSKELMARLEASQHLIVICSPHSAQSEWVGKEIAYFHSLGRAKNIHFFIVDGTPHSANPETECFNPILKELDLPEILGANIHERNYRLPWLNWERAYIQLVTKLLGIEFDALWNRHRRLLIEQVVTWLIGVLVVASVIVNVYFVSQPVNVEMSLNELTPINNNLPPLKNAKVSLILDNEKKDTTSLNIGEKVTFTNVPHDMIGKEVRVTFTCDGYIPVDTVEKLSKKISIDVRRDEKTYGTLMFYLLSSSSLKPLPNIDIKIKGKTYKTDKNGHLSVLIPLEQQDTCYKLESPVHLLSDTLYFGCTESTIIEAQ